MTYGHNKPLYVTFSSEKMLHCIDSKKKHKRQHLSARQRNHFLLMLIYILSSGKRSKKMSVIPRRRRRKKRFHLFSNFSIAFSQRGRGFIFSLIFYRFFEIRITVEQHFHEKGQPSQTGLSMLANMSPIFADKMNGNNAHFL